MYTCSFLPLTIKIIDIKSLSFGAFAILPAPADVVTQVKESEMTNPYRSKIYWMCQCGHCSIHSENLKSHEIVVTHLKSVYVSSFIFTYPSFLPIHCFSLFIYLGLTRLESRKIYSSSHETRLSIHSRLDTWLMPPPV